MVAVIFSAWGLFLDKAFAGDFQGLQQQATAEAQILPPNAGWSQRAIGVMPRPSTEGQEARPAAQEEERGDSYSSPASSDGDGD